MDLTTVWRQKRSVFFLLGLLDYGRNHNYTYFGQYHNHDYLNMIRSLQYDKVTNTRLTNVGKKALKQLLKTGQLLKRNNK